MTKTTKVLSIINELRHNRENNAITKAELFNFLGKSRAQNYRMLSELTQNQEKAPALLIKVGDSYKLNEQYK